MCCLEKGEIFLDAFLIYYLIGVGVGVIIYLGLQKLIRPSEEFNSIGVMLVGFLAILFSFLYGGWDGMLIATMGAGAITFGIVMFIVWLVKRYKNKKTRNGA